MEDIEAFSRTYRTRLDEAEIARSVPENLCLEVSTSISLLTLSMLSIGALILFVVYEHIIIDYHCFINLVGGWEQMRPVIPLVVHGADYG